MRLIKSTVNLQFSEALAPWLTIRDLLRTAAADTSVEMQGAPLVVDRAAERKRVTLQLRGVEAEQDWTPSTRTPIEAQAAMLKTIHELNSACPFPPPNQAIYAQLFIEPYGLPFRELVNLMKRRYLAGSSRLSDVSTDLALVFDYHEGNVLKSVHMGPMNSDQLQAQYLRWPANDLPEVFLFAALTYTTQLEAVPFSDETLTAIVSDATTWQASESDTIAAELR